MMEEGYVGHAMVLTCQVRNRSEGKSSTLAPQVHWTASGDPTDQETETESSKLLLSPSRSREERFARESIF